jgi:diguanylate cyclase (GGDEF)-like protein/PAS domain S-box-containing protein
VQGLDLPDAIQGSGSGAEDRFRYLVENAFDIVLECATSGRILYVSPNIRDVLGVEPGDLVGRFLVDYLHPEDMRKGFESFSSAVAGSGQIHETLRYRHVRGGWRYIEGRGKAYVTPSGKSRVVIIGRDVTASLLADESLRSAQTRLEMHLQQLPVAVIGWDAQGCITEWNPAAVSMFGYEREEAIGKAVSPLIEAVGDHADIISRNLENVPDDPTQPFRVAAENRKKNGDTILCEWSIVALHDVSGAVTGTLAIAEDLSLRDRARRLEEAAFKDPVTGMPNRRYFDDRLAACAGGVRRRDDSFAVLYIDLDDFKPINDRYGHHIGDAVLTAVGLRLRVCIRDIDVVARLGGDEFGVLLTHLDRPDYAEEVARRIIDSLRKPLTAGDEDYHVAASIGISTYPRDGGDPSTLLRRADAAMYRAKEKGKSTYSL